MPRPRKNQSQVIVKYPAKKRVQPVQVVLRGRGAYYPRPRYLSGRGDYYDKPLPPPPSLGRRVLQYGGRTLGGAIGGFIGGPSGASIGQNLGGMAGNAISDLVGFGDYKVSKNVFLSGSIPAIHNVGKGEGTTIRFTEYIGDVISHATPNTFKLDSYRINPGNNQFPWISAIAPNYQEWVPEGIVFCFKSVSSDAISSSTNNTLGTIIMATNYDSSQPVFGSQAEMLNSEYSSQVKPSLDCYHMIECARKNTVLDNLYVRSNATQQAATQDPRFYDLGIFQIASNGVQGASTKLGQLWITYQFTLRKQRLYDVLGSSILYAKLKNIVGVTAAVPFGTAGNATINDADNNTLPIALTATTATLPVSNVVQTFMMIFSWNGTAAAVTLPVFTFTNATQILAVIPFPQSGLAGQQQAAQIIYFSTNGDGTQPVITAGGAGTVPGGTVTMYLTITQVQNGISGL